MRRGLILILVAMMALMAAQQVVSAPLPEREREQKGNSTLSGVVLGPDDRPVPRASITYQSSGGHAPHAVHTDAHGRFTLTKLRADNYDLRASANGVFSEWEKNVTVGKGQTRSITLRLIYARSMPKSASSTKKPKS